MENRMKALAEYRAKVASGEIEKPERMNPLQKAQANPQSMKYAIRAACCDCVGGDGTPGWQNEIKLCPVAKCALHHVRPYK